MIRGAVKEIRLSTKTSKPLRGPTKCAKVSDTIRQNTDRALMTNGKRLNTHLPPWVTNSVLPNVLAYYGDLPVGALNVAHINVFIGTAEGVSVGFLCRTWTNSCVPGVYFGWVVVNAKTRRSVGFDIDRARGSSWARLWLNNAIGFHLGRIFINDFLHVGWWDKELCRQGTCQVLKYKRVV